MDVGDFYLGRLIKIGDLTTEKIVAAIVDPVEHFGRFYAYTFIDAKTSRNGAGTQYVYAKLVKFLPKTSLQTIDRAGHTETVQDLEDVIQVAVPFIYIPDYSGLGYLHVADGLPEHMFRRIFPKLITAKYDHILIEAHVEPIVDLRTFFTRIQALRSIDRIASRVQPPNPLFGPLWKSLRDYLRQRAASELVIREEAATREGLNTNIVNVISIFVNSKSDDPDSLTKLLNEKFPNGISTTDAAVLMSADGYGQAQVRGDGEYGREIVRTSGSQLKVELPKDPNPDELYKEIKDSLDKINRDRHLRHE